MDDVYVPSPRRARRDSAWSFAFIALALVTIALGVAVAATAPRRAPSDALARDALTSGDAWFGARSRDAVDEALKANAREIANDARRREGGLGRFRMTRGKGEAIGKTIGVARERERGLGGNDSDDAFGARGGAIDGKTFLKAAMPWIVVAFVGAFFIGAGLMTVLRTRARDVVWGVMYLKIAVLAALTVITAVSAQLTAALLCGLGTALAVLVTYMWRGELDLVASMIAVSTQGLRDNPHLVTVTVGLQLASMVYVIPLVWLAVDATQHGSATINKFAVATTDGMCLGYYSQTVDCCRWQMDSWVPSYITLVCVAVIWAVSTALEARLFVIGGVVCQWYFAPAGTTNFKGTTTRSLQHALGPSFGTICYGSFVITVVEILKRSAEKMRRENRGNILVCLCVACLDCIYALIEYISRFAMIQASMSGEAFCDAARSITDLLSRNFLLAYGTYAFPKYILSAVVVILSMAFGYVAYVTSAIGYAFTEDVFVGKAYSYGVGILCFAITYIVLDFFVMILLNVVDSIFVCYAIDKDRNAVHHPDLHAVFAEVNDKQTREQEDDGISKSVPLSKQAVYASM